MPFDFSPWGVYGYGAAQNQPSPTPAPAEPAAPSGGTPSPIPGGGYSAPVSGITDSQPAPQPAPVLPQQMPQPIGGGNFTNLGNGGTPNSFLGQPVSNTVAAQNNRISSGGTGNEMAGNTVQAPYMPQGGGGQPVGQPGANGLGSLIQLLMGGGTQAGANPIMSLLQLIAQNRPQAGGLQPGGAPTTAMNGSVNPQPMGIRNVQPFGTGNPRGLAQQVGPPQMPGQVSQQNPFVSLLQFLAQNRPQGGLQPGGAPTTAMNGSVNPQQWMGGSTLTGG